jgi:hypothetical protein
VFPRPMDGVLLSAFRRGRYFKIRDKQTGTLRVPVCLLEVEWLRAEQFWEVLVVRGRLAGE